EERCSERNRKIGTSFWRLGVDRSHHWLNVQREERGVDSPFAQGADRAAKSPDLQALDRSAVFGSAYHFAFRNEDRVAVGQAGQGDSGGGRNRHQCGGY